MATKSVRLLELGEDQVSAIRRALVIGLNSFGEIERVENAQNIATDICKQNVPERQRVLHPTGAADTVSLFAEALTYIEFPRE